MRNFTPPIRMVLTAKCNGKCAFCHHEGYSGEVEMSVALASQIAVIAQKKSISSISITGGEPTLHPQLPEIITAIQQHSNASISLTTNGYRLLEVAGKIRGQINKLNVSIASFDNALNSKYQNVDIEKVKTAVLSFPSEQKFFNVFVNKENYGVLDEIICFCKKNAINLDLMFDLQHSLIGDDDVERSVITKFLALGNPSIIPGNPFVMSFDSNDIVFRIKHPRISALMKRNICIDCTERNSCLEKVCAVRVFPDESVSPCLSRHYYFSDGSIEQNLDAAYRLFEKDELLLQALFR